MNHKLRQLAAPTRRFTVLLSPSPRGARLARMLATEQLCSWNLPYGMADTAAHIVAELATNAATHGRVAGRDFRLALHTTERERALRIEVTDTRDGLLPGTRAQAPPDDSESGPGLLLVEVLADRWGVTLGPVPRKTVWAELDLVPEAPVPLVPQQGGSRHVAPEHGYPGSGDTSGLFQETEEKEPHQTPPLPPTRPSHSPG
ncbi:ATP-binding protein [Streptomyces sp. NPDC055078]